MVEVVEKRLTCMLCGFGIVDDLVRRVEVPDSSVTLEELILLWHVASAHSSAWDLLFGDSATQTELLLAQIHQFGFDPVFDLEFIQSD